MTHSTTYTFGLDTFGDRNGDAGGVPVSHAQAIRNVVEEGVFAGRAEVILGGGSSIDSFPLSGYDLADYELLFDEKATLFAELLKGGPVTWEGKTRAPLANQDVVPTPSLGRSRPGSGSAAIRSRWSAPPALGSAWRWRSSAAAPPGSRRTRSRSGVP